MIEVLQEPGLGLLLNERRSPGVRVLVHSAALYVSQRRSSVCRRAGLFWVPRAVAEENEEVHHKGGMGADRTRGRGA